MIAVGDITKKPCPLKQQHENFGLVLGKPPKLQMILLYFKTQTVIRTITLRLYSRSKETRNYLTGSELSEPHRVRDIFNT